MVAQGAQVRAKSSNESTIHPSASVEITNPGVQGSHSKAVKSIETVNAKQHGKQPGKDDSVYD